MRLRFGSALCHARIGSPGSGRWRLVGTDDRGRPVIVLLDPGTKYERPSHLWIWTEDHLDSVDVRGGAFELDRYLLEEGRVTRRTSIGLGRAGTGHGDVARRTARASRRRRVADSATHLLSRTATYDAGGDPLALRSASALQDESGEPLPRLGPALRKRPRSTRRSSPGTDASTDSPSGQTIRKAWSSRSPPRSLAPSQPP